MDRFFVLHKCGREEVNANEEQHPQQDAQPQGQDVFRYKKFDTELFHGFVVKMPAGSEAIFTLNIYILNTWHAIKFPCFSLKSIVSASSLVFRLISCLTDGDDSGKVDAEAPEGSLFMKNPPWGRRKNVWEKEQRERQNSQPASDQ